MDAVNELKTHRRIVGTPLTLEEMLNPVEEEKAEDLLYQFEGGDEEIVAQVRHENAVQKGEII